MKHQDKYANFDELAANEHEHQDYEIVRERRSLEITIITPHGGGIEPGTSEIAKAIAGNEFSLYCFEGKKDKNNKILHITSTNFDEPKCLQLVSESQTVVAIHGLDDKSKAVYVGGCNDELKGQIVKALGDADFAARRDETAAHSALDPQNICNKARSGRGVQLEIAIGLRHSMFKGPLNKRSGRREKMPEFKRFVETIRETLIKAQAEITFTEQKKMAEAEAQETATEAASNRVKYRVEGGIALLTLNDPPANTYSYEMMQELDRSILAARMDESVQVIVITGAGEKFFCAGADIQMLSSVTPTFKYFFCLHANETLSRLEQTPKLVIAAINGHCVGGGLEVAMAADIRVARKGAGKMGLPEVSLGVLPGTGGTQRLARIVGKSRAIELMAAGELFDFERGQELGLINHVYEAASAEQFMQQVMEYAGKFTTPNKAAHAVGRIKRSVQSGAEIPFEYGLALEREMQQQLFQSEDAKEGLDAYVQKRKPNFRGR